MRVFQTTLAVCVLATATTALAQESGIRVRSIRGFWPVLVSAQEIFLRAKRTPSITNFRQGFRWATVTSRQRRLDYRRAPSPGLTAPWTIWSFSSKAI